MDMEYKTVEAQIKSIDEKGTGVLRFIKFDQEDKDADITLPGFIGKQKAHLLPAHNWKSDHPPLGSGESFEADGATNFRFRLNLNTSLGKEWRDHLMFDKQHGSLQQVSYGFSPYADGQEKWQKEGRSGRYLKPRPDGSPGAKLHEVSFVVVGSGNDTAVLNIKSADQFLSDEEKAEGFRIQSLIFPKDKWESAEAVRSWLSSHDFSTELDATGSSWRARQEEPGKFARLRTICINPSRDASSEACRVQAVGGPMKESRSMEQEDPIVEPPETNGSKDAALVDAEDWKNYSDEKRPPLDIFIKWLRGLNYHVKFVWDVRKRHGKDLSEEMVENFKDLAEEVLETCALLKITLIKAKLLPTMEEEELERQRRNEKYKELTTYKTQQEAQAEMQLQAQGEDLVRKARARDAEMKQLKLK